MSLHVQTWDDFLQELQAEAAGICQVNPAARQVAEEHPQFNQYTVASLFLFQALPRPEQDAVIADAIAQRAVFYSGRPLRYDDLETMTSHYRALDVYTAFIAQAQMTISSLYSQQEH